MKKHKWNTQKMGKIQKRLYEIAVISFVIVCLLLLLGATLKSAIYIHELVIKIACYICIIVLLIVFTILMISIGMEFIAKIIQAMGNLKYCEDEIFDEIEQYVRHWVAVDNHYLRVIKVINSKYKKGGAIDCEIKTKGEIGRLYRRLDYLRIDNDFSKDLVSNMMAFLISIVATIVINLITESFGEEVRWIFLFEVAGIVFCCLGVVFATVLQYSNRGKNKDGLSFVREYEIERLTKYIHKWEKSVVMKSQDEMIVKNQNAIIQTLISLAMKKRNNEKVLRHLEIIEKLDLSLNSYKHVVFKKYIFEKKEIFILYNKKEKFASDSYKDLYSILSDEAYSFVEIK